MGGWWKMEVREGVGGVEEIGVEGEGWFCWEGGVGWRGGGGGVL